MKVLITGASGLLGRQLVKALENDHELRLLSRRQVSGDSRWHQADITRLDQLIPAMQGMDAVCHLAIAPGFEGDYEDDDFNQLRFDVNVKGTFNVLEAARLAGVKRFVHTSSLTVVWGYQPPEWVAGDAPPRPVGSYALTKYLAEEICRYFATVHGVSILCMRIPKPVDLADEKMKQMAILPQWIAFPDLIQAYRKALEVPDIGFEIVSLAGESSVRRWDTSMAEKLLGYKAEVRLEDLGYSFRQEPGSYDQGKVVFED